MSVVHLAEGFKLHCAHHCLRNTALNSFGSENKVITVSFGCAFGWEYILDVSRNVAAQGGAHAVRVRQNIDHVLVYFIDRTILPVSVLIRDAWAVKSYPRIMWRAV